MLFFLRKIFTLLVLLTASNLAQAFDRAVLNGIRPYAGADAGQRVMTYKAGRGKDLFYRYTPQWTPYLGLQFYDYFALEGGYESTGRKTKTVALSPGDNDLGFPLTGIFAAPQVARYTELLQGWHINLIVFGPCFEPFPSSLPPLHFFAGVGLSQKKIRLVSTILDIAGPLSPEDIAENERNFIKKRSLLRLSVGLQQLLTDNMGIRAIVGWENTNRFDNLKPLESPEGFSTASLRNTISFGLGFFVKF